MKITTKKELINILQDFWEFTNHNTALHKISPEKFKEIARTFANYFYGTNKIRIENGEYLKIENNEE